MDRPRGDKERMTQRGFRVLWFLLVCAVVCCGVGYAADPITLAWTNPATHVDGSPADDLTTLYIYRSVNGEAFALYARVAASATTFVDTAPAQGSNAYYVTAVATGGTAESAPSNTVVQLTAPLTTGTGQGAGVTTGQGGGGGLSQPHGGP